MSGQKRFLADVLWEAANWHLSDDGTSRHAKWDNYSCFAVAIALGLSYGAVTHGPTVNSEDAAFNFLYELGCTFDCAKVWDGLNSQPEEYIQGVRYMWLLLAMHVAEDEGITL